MRKGELYISLIVAVFLTFYYGAGMIKIRSISTKSDFVFDIPRIEPITLEAVKLDNVGDFKAWNVKPVYREGVGNIAIPSQNTSKKGGVEFVFKRIDGVPALLNVLNQKYRWEFFGTVKTKTGWQAVFFNPALKMDSLKVLSGGMKLDSHLILKQVNSDNVIVEFIANKERKYFVLSVFNVTMNKAQKEVGGK